MVLWYWGGSSQDLALTLLESDGRESQVTPTHPILIQNQNKPKLFKTFKEQPINGREIPNLSRNNSIPNETISNMEVNNKKKHSIPRHFHASKIHNIFVQSHHFHFILFVKMNNDF